MLNYLQEPSSLLLASARRSTIWRNPCIAKYSIKIIKHYKRALSQLQQIRTCALLQVQTQLVVHSGNLQQG